MNDDAAAATGQQVTAATCYVDAIFGNDPDFICGRVRSGQRSQTRHAQRSAIPAIDTLCRALRPDADFRLVRDTPHRYLLGECRDVGEEQSWAETAQRFS